MHTFRHGLFSATGLICAWLVAAGFLAPAGLVTLLSMHEGYFVPIATFGMWWIAGTIAVHWWIPSHESGRHWREALAAAGWHVALATAATGIVGWIVLFRDGLDVRFALGDALPVLIAWATFTGIVGIVLIRLRVHDPARTLRYSLFSLSLGISWMAIGLVAIHSGV